ncbi:septal ring lytic transglycosylase RlpA family protein [Pseudoleptotrichia goodfellowii]|uniref:Probable endolytic peptidoglycan transglycosylase RlpA n=1 Tax=Pseudoleptotrichia goodfellowii F0264 TaxID=596323 RepID=D0GMT4_9FUSO|nr:septal ring lytic transglycosylase RlpA family protein [Pseudoleptotrichia goodfellowii]EEY34606.1 putative rare lipoprotein A double-psi beta-barrel protein [Pseudoleptotrichia goodfellowii F0264]
MKKIITILMGLILTLFISLPIKGNNKKLTDDLKKSENKIKTTENRDDIYDEEIKEELAKYSYFQTGTASFYGGKWHGRKTANGEIFDTYKLTAAHKTLPFGTRVRVTNLSNGKSVVVRINNRGPYSKGRIIDLSQAAFSKIENMSKGVTKVKLEIVK